MEQYVTREEAEVYQATHPTIEHPNMAANLEEYPAFAPPLTFPGSIDPTEPSPAVCEVMDLIGEAEEVPKRVLDLGSGFSPTGLYLAVYGHDVTLVDGDPSTLDWQYDHAAKFGLLDNLRLNCGDVLNLANAGEKEKYDIIIAEHLLHFMGEQDSRRMLTAIRAATLVGGLNVISAYSPDNPVEEMLPHRGLRQFFASEDIRDSYPEDEWEVVFEQQGDNPYWRARPDFGPNTGMIPNVVELVMRRTSEKEPPLLGIPTEIANQYLVFDT